MSLPSIYQTYQRKAFPGKVIEEFPYIFHPDEWLGQFPLHVQETYAATGIMSGWLHHLLTASEVYHLGCLWCKNFAKIAVTRSTLQDCAAMNIREVIEDRLQQSFRPWCSHLRAFFAGEEDG